MSFVGRNWFIAAEKIASAFMKKGNVKRPVKYSQFPKKRSLTEQHPAAR
jgi:hypothetical protein